MLVGVTLVSYFMFGLILLNKSLIKTGFITSHDPESTILQSFPTSPYSQTISYAGTNSYFTHLAISNKILGYNFLKD